MTNRDAMMGRIRDALGKDRTEPSAGPLPLENVLPAIRPEDLMARFEHELEEVGGVAHRARQEQGVEEVLRPIVAAAGARRAVLSRNPLLVRLAIADRLRAWGVEASAWEGEASSGAPFREGCFAAEIGISGADFALAESGSLALTSRTEGSQLVSLAPPIHIAIVLQTQIRASLDEVLTELHKQPAPGEAGQGRSIVFVTGTSRTADIEQILIRGVHGPRELHVILVEAEAAAAFQSS